MAKVVKTEKLKEQLKNMSIEELKELGLIKTNLCVLEVFKNLKKLKNTAFVGIIASVLAVVYGTEVNLILALIPFPLISYFAYIFTDAEKFINYIKNKYPEIFSTKR